MAVARLVAAPFPLAAARARVPPARLPFAPLSARPLSRRAAAPALRVASDGNGGLVPARPGQEAPEDAATAPARGAVSERAARKESERRTYLVAALMSSLGITSMAAAAVYYRFAWQMESEQNSSCRRAFPLKINRTACAGGDGVLGAVGAPGAVARVAVGHARVAPPPPRRALRAQRRVRHRQRRPGHGPPRLRLLQPRPPPRPLLRRRSRDHAVRDGLHVRPRRPGPPPLPRGPHRERALLPASRRRAPAITWTSSTACHTGCSSAPR
uniref:beta-carotene 3-hydroxylase n=1 Tax=Aegilops tauschii subsp. strangulata TaxID=200361 RepID=A0A453J1H0_AEGTS